MDGSGVVVSFYGQRITKADQAALEGFCRGNLPRLEWERDNDGRADMISLRSTCDRIAFHIFPKPAGGWVFIDEDQNKLAAAARITDLLRAVRPY